MTPTIALTCPKETFATIDPFNIAAGESSFVPIDITPRNVDPGVVFLGEYWTHFARVHIAKHDEICVLQAVELLNDDFVGVACPLHPGEIVVTRISSNIKPTCSTTISGNHAHASGGVCFTGFGIRKCSQGRVECRCIVDKRHLFDAFGI